MFLREKCLPFNSGGDFGEFCDSGVDAMSRIRLREWFGGMLYIYGESIVVVY